MPNGKIAYAALDWIRVNPDDWNQAHWAKCYAAVVLRTSGCGIDTWPPLPVVGKVPADMDPDMMRRVLHYDVESAALALLEIDDDFFSTFAGGTRWLFAAGNTLDELDEIVMRMFGPREVEEEPATT